MAGFREAFERERDLFYAAATATPAAWTQLGHQGLEAMLARRSRYLSGTDARFAELEDVFLIMEGAANSTALAFVPFLHASGVQWRADVVNDAPPLHHRPGPCRGGQENP